MEVDDEISILQRKIDDIRANRRRHNEEINKTPEQIIEEAKDAAKQAGVAAKAALATKPKEEELEAGAEGGHGS